MHVAIVTVFPQDRHCIDGGVAGVSKYLVDELTKHPDVKVSVVVPTGPAGETICEGWGQFNVYRLGKEGPWSFLPGTLYDLFAGKRRIGSLLKQLKPDIVHFQACTFLAADCEQPHILTIHGIAERDALWDRRRRFLRGPRRRLLKLTEDYGRRRVPHVVLISEYAREFIPSENSIRKTWLIDNPVADSYFTIERAFEPGRIFCCSRIRPLKNILGMIQAFALVVQQFPQAQLRIAGTAEATYLRACEKQIKAMGVQGKVHFLGNISIEDVQRELSRANCLVVPSFQENAPLTIAEAMAGGVPVVAAKVGGIPGMLKNGETGLLIDPHNIKSIAQAVQKILSDEPLARSMGLRGRQAAERRFKASIVCEKTLRAYQEVLEQSSQNA
ncbi:MAG TPA: glycosyltransferase family 4 protein [Sedimentisphaerales bacterium]|nr:glycosyltransferase family 4 protein [Sedimentisphaerales bacterium]